MHTFYPERKFELEVIYMIRKLFSAMLFAALVFALTAPGALAQRTSPDTDRTGSAAASWLLIPTTARSASLGMAATGGIASMNGIEAALENPASLVVNEGTAALFSRVNYVADIGLNTFGIAQRFGNNDLALVVSAWDFGDIPVTTEESPDVTELTPTWTATFVSAGLTYSRLFTDRIAAGVTSKLVTERMSGDMSATTVAFDAGMTYIVGESGLRFGVSLKNFGPSLKYTGDGLVREVIFPGEDRRRTTVIEAEDFELPSLLNFGLSYRRELAAGLSATALGNFRSNAYQSPQYSGGLEIGLREILYVRGGYQWEENLDTNFFEGWNVGAGLNLELSGMHLQVDYAYRPTNVFDAVQMITASIVL